MRRIAFDFFAGSGSSTVALKENGWQVVRFELDETLNPDLCLNILDLDVDFLLGSYGRPDFIWASPPCTALSVASMGHHWDNRLGSPTPKTEAARVGVELVAHTVRLIAGLQPKLGWLMENPRGMLRKLDVVKGLPRATLSYCKYGDSRMKPTDVWGGIDNWLPSKMCRNNSPCHEPAPRGSHGGTQGILKVSERSKVPYGLSKEVAERLEQYGNSHRV
jgi:hypothetical protein